MWNIKLEREAAETSHGFSPAELIQCIRTPYDRIYVLTKYLRVNGSLHVPVYLMQAIGAHPKGFGTMIWTDGVSSFGVYGEVSSLKDQQAHSGTISIAKMYATYTDSFTGAKIHMDYNLRSLNHCIFHVHYGNSKQEPLVGQKALEYLNNLKAQISNPLRTLLSSQSDSSFVIKAWEEG